MAELVDAAAPGPAGQLRVLPRRDQLVLLAGELHQALDHDRAGRHVDAESESLGREHDLHETPLRRAPRPSSLNGGIIPAWCAATPRAEAADPVVVTEDVQLVRR